METAPLKSFATSARTELIREVNARITAVLSQGSPERVESPKAVASLEKAIAAGDGDNGKAHVADKVAYTWFNRIIALRFMDANRYTGVGVVSPAADQVGQPEVLAAAKRGQIDKDVVSRPATLTSITGLLNGTRQPRHGVDAQAEAYALLLTAYCRFWNKTMPFMFEREGDFTELLIPANLLAEDAFLNRSVHVLTTEVCQDVEVIGWLYQFYIAEKKDAVFAGFKKNKKAGPDEIPAATQLFTPHWIVRYLVENSLGRLWMLNRPNSRLVDQMDFYIAPVDEETDFLEIAKPEELKVIDPACGSGHMLTYAFDLLYAVYEEEGYTPSEIPGLILANNLFGTEIDPRAGALAAFALTMKAAGKRKLFLKNPVKPNICVLVPISFNRSELDFLATRDGDREAAENYWNQFAKADMVGSLIKPDPDLTISLAQHLETMDAEGDLYKSYAIERAQQTLVQATFLLPRYSVVVANPPYMGSKNMDGDLIDWLKNHYSDVKSDLFSAFIVRNSELCVPTGMLGYMTPMVWMFISSHFKLRQLILKQKFLATLIQLEYSGFEGATVPICAFTVKNSVERRAEASFIRLSDFKGVKEQAPRTLEAIRNPDCGWMFRARPTDLVDIPGAPIAYWATLATLGLFKTAPSLGSVGDTRQGMATGLNETFVRQWHEVSFNKVGLGMSRAEALESGSKWFPYASGGMYKKWFGNFGEVVNWEDDGRVLQSEKNTEGRIRAHNFNLDHIFREGVTWTSITSAKFSVRYLPRGFLFSSAANALFSDRDLLPILGLLNSDATGQIMKMLNPTLNANPGDVDRIPYALSDEAIHHQVEQLVRIAEVDWASRETSWEFSASDLVAMRSSRARVSDAIADVSRRWIELARTTQELEQSINEIVNRRYGFVGTTSQADPQIRHGDVTLTRIGNSKLPNCEGHSEWGLNIPSEMASFVSYAVGCMFGRYSVDEPGIILADQGSKLQDYLVKIPNPTFAPDEDNVIPMVDGDWFEDDIVSRFRAFLRVTFGEQHFEENLAYVGTALTVKNLRDYFVTKSGRSKFYDDHVQRYKKRPIYWLFSSPKGSFNALIYMHRYTPSTVSTVLTYLREYVTKLESSLQQAERDQNAKEADRLRKILVELNEYEHDTLYPKASENIAIDLDDGVKANYPKFGAALRKIAGLEASDG